MTFSPDTSVLETFEAIYPDPSVKASLIESTDGLNKKIDLEFFFAIRMSEILDKDYSVIEYYISSETSGESYSFFSGDTSSIEEDILGWAKTKYESPSAHEEKYNSYFHKEDTLYSILPDSLVGSPETSYEREFEFFQRGTVQEAVVPLTGYVVQGSDESLQEAHQDCEAIKSMPSGAVANLPFPRLTTTQASEGLPGAKFPLDSYVSEQLRFYSNLLDVDLSNKENMLEVVTEQTNYWPVKLRATMEFSQSEFPIINSLLLKDSLTLTIKLKKADSFEAEAIISPIEFSLRDAILKSTSDLIPLRVTVLPPGESNTKVYDVLTITNENGCSVSGKIGLYGYSDSLGSMSKGFFHNFVVPASSEIQVPMMDSVKFPSRFYQGYCVNSVYQQFKGLINDVATPTPQVPFHAYLPYISNNNLPQHSDPKILGVLNSESMEWTIYLINIPPYIDKVRFYARPSKKRGQAAYRSPGISRGKNSRWAFIEKSPSSIGEKLSSNSTSITFPAASISKESAYEILADLEIEDAVVDTVCTPIYNTKVRGIKSRVDCNLGVISASGDNSTDLVSLSASVSPTSDSIIDSLISQTTITNEYLESFNEAMAESTVNVWYRLFRCNIGGNGDFEDLGFYNSGNHRVPVDSDSSITRVYIARVYALTIGQLMISNPPTAISPAWPGTGGGSQQYFKNYSKFNSATSEVFDKLPNSEYLTTTRVSLGAYTGYQMVSSVSSGEKVSPTFSLFRTEYDQVKKIRVLSWSVEESGANYVPEYYIVLAEYGGVTAPVAWAINEIGGSNQKQFAVKDNVLSKAIGTINYKVYAVYMDGIVSNTGLSQTVGVSDNRFEKFFNLR